MSVCLHGERTASGRTGSCFRGAPVRAKRRANDTLVIKKKETEYVFPLNPLYEPIVPQDLWERVQRKLKEREHVNPSFGKRRTKDRAKHPLNGRLFCPDCDAPMVLGSYMPGRGKRHHCFHCGTWRKTIRTKCNANTVRWEYLDQATERLLETVKDRIDGLTTPKALLTLQNEEWAKQTELGRLFVEIVHGAVPAELRTKDTEKFWRHLWKKFGNDDMSEVWELVCRKYRERWEADRGPMTVELEKVTAELNQIAEVLTQPLPSQTVRQRLYSKMADLERRKVALEPKVVPLTDTAEALMETLQAVRKTIEDADQQGRADLIAAFVSKVYPIFRVEIQGGKRKGMRRTKCIGFRFEPTEQGERRVMPRSMEILFARTGTGSSTPPA